MTEKIGNEGANRHLYTKPGVKCGVTKAIDNNFIEVKKELEYKVKIKES